MLISWIKQFIRVSVKGGFYSVVNTLGLSIGLGCTIIILLWIDFNTSFDKFHSDYRRIYQVYEIQSYSDGYKLYTYSTPAPLAVFLNEKFPNIEASARFTKISAIIGMSDEAFREDEIGFTDSTFFKIFNVEFIARESLSCLRDPNSVVLSETLANKIFGSTDVIGRSIRMNGTVELNITGLIKDYPKNSTIRFSCLIPFETAKNFGFGGLDKWGWNSHATFVKVYNNFEIDSMASQISHEVIKKGVGENTSMKLHPISDVHLYSPDPNGFGYNIFIAILGSVAVFVLILACINFINLITARAANRAKEVGIRKVIGSTRSQLITQYFLESFLNSIISLLIAIILVEFALPGFNATLGTELKLSFLDYHFWSKILMVVIIVGVGSGLYPAFVLSSFQPAKVLKGILRSGLRGAGFRKTMVIIQYTITIFIVVITFFLFKQLRFISTIDTGMSRKNVASIPFRKDMDPNYMSFKKELMKIPGISYVTGIQNLPFQIYNSTSSIDWKGKDTLQTYLFSNTISDEYLTDLMGIKMVEGRFFSSEYPSDTSCVVINETAAKIININPIVGEQITVWGDKLQVIGVMKDFYFTHFAEKLQPLFIKYGTTGIKYVLIKSNGSYDNQLINNIKRVFTDFYPDYPFESTLLDDDYHRMFKIEKQLSSILSQFSVLAILISCVGLLSLAAYIAEQQRKSLVLRKIHGASLFKILSMLINSFTKWVVISGIIAIPLAYLTLKNLFANYTFHTSFSWWIFADSLIGALIIAIVTVLYQAIKTARTNPSDILRYE